jgi:glycosyltransferase involved in cell wall biosynthesis
MKLVVTVPAQDEERTIRRVIEDVPDRIEGIDTIDVVVLDDGSTDGTAAEARAAGADVVTVHARPGLSKVFQVGVDEAMRRGADFLVNIDGDGQFDPADIAQLVKPLVDDAADFVTCTRFKNPQLAPKPTMPKVKLWGNHAVVKIVNFACGGGQRFTDVSCGFRAFNREAFYRLTLFGKYTYTQECFIDLFSKNLRILEVPLAVQGIREHGESRVAGNVWKYAANTFPIILRAMRDIRPLSFFGLLAAGLAVLGLIPLLVVTVNYLYLNPLKTTPYTSLITIGGGFMTLSFIVAVMALLADMMARQRRITEELLYLARKRIYGGKTPAPTVVTQPRQTTRNQPQLVNGNGHHHGNGNGLSNGNGNGHSNGNGRKTPVYRETRDVARPAVAAAD